jgi:hypothetical protein
MGEKTFVVGARRRDYLLDLSQPAEKEVEQVCKLLLERTKKTWNLNHRISMKTYLCE